MPPFELKFGSPRHGWLDVTLSTPERTTSFDASSVPNDSLSALVVAVLDLLTGRREARVVWFLEPAERTWLFQRVDGRVELHTLDDESAPLVVGGDLEEFALILWRALRRLESDPFWTLEGATRGWRHPFPHREVAQLGDALGRGHPK